MLITEIDESNLYYFSEAILERYALRSTKDTFIGLVDDSDRAVGAAALSARHDNMQLDYIGIEDASQGRGLGSYFINAIAECIDETMFKNLTAIMYLKPDESDNSITKFLKNNGFSVQTLEGRRNCYDLRKICKMARESDRKKFDTGTIHRGFELDEKLRENLFALDDRYFTKSDAYIDAEEVLSEDNLYGGVYVKDGKIVSSLVAMPCADGILIEGVYAAAGEGTNGLKELFDNAVVKVADQKEIPPYLYIDTIGSVFQKYEEKLMGDKGIKPVDTYEAYVFTRELR